MTRVSVAHALAAALHSVGKLSAHLGGRKAARNKHIPPCNFLRENKKRSGSFLKKEPRKMCLLEIGLDSGAIFGMLSAR
jgi:hypothetical protein